MRDGTQSHSFLKKLSPIEQRYEVHDGELMAIVQAFKQWGQDLRGASETIVVRTDHHNLKYFITKRKLNGRQARWAERLADFDFTIEYRTGKTNPADGPSRRPDHQGSEPYQVEEGGEESLPSLYQKLRMATIVKWDQQEKGKNKPRTGDVLGLDHRSNMQESWAKDRCNQQQGVPYVHDVADATGCKQYVSRKTAIAVLSSQTVFGDVTESIHDVLQRLQSTDAFVFNKTYEKIPTRTTFGSKSQWLMDAKGLLRYRGAAYVANQRAIP